MLVLVFMMPDSARCFCYYCHYRQSAPLLRGWACARSYLLQSPRSLLVAVALGHHLSSAEAVVVTVFLDCSKMAVISVTAVAISVKDVHY